MNIEETAARKLTARSMTIEEMRSYLLKKGFEKEETESMIAMLREDGYLNDSRYCMEYFEYAFAKNKSRKRVFVELRKKGVADDVIEIAFDDYEADDEVEFDELKMARNEAEKTLRMADLTWDDPVPDKIKGRIARKLDSYGYAPAIIYEILGELKK